MWIPLEFTKDTHSLISVTVRFHLNIICFVVMKVIRTQETARRGEEVQPSSLDRSQEARRTLFRKEASEECEAMLHLNGCRQIKEGRTGYLLSLGKGCLRTRDTLG